MKHLLIFSTVLLFAFGCTPPMYIPNTTNVPTLKEKGDADISYSTGTNGHDIQTAYAITDEFGVMLNSSYGNRKSDSSINYNKHKFLELGSGYTFDLDKDSKGILRLFLAFLVVPALECQKGLIIFLIFLVLV